MIMEKSLLVSIIVPVYNVERYLGKCLDSLCRQTYTNIEIVVVDDGSPDRSGEIIKNYQRIDNRIKYIKRKNGGLGAARNTGIKESSGEFICFVDSDDWVSPNYVERFVETTEADGSDVVISNIRYVFEDGKEKSRTPRIFEHSIVNNREALALEFIGTHYKFHAPNKFCKKSIFTENNILFPEGKLYEDVFTTYKMLLSASRISLIPDVTYYYLQSRSGSIMNTELKKQRFVDMFEALDSILTNPQIKSLGLDDELQCLYVGNAISLVNYIYPMIGKAGRRKIKEYEGWVKSDKNYWILATKIWKNAKLNVVSKIRAYMIRYCFIPYCTILKCAKTVMGGKFRNGNTNK